jgi:hypothetical protein
MILNLWEDCRRVLAEGNYTPWLATADEFSDRAYEPGYGAAGAAMEPLLRKFVEVQTLVRMSQEAKAELAEIDAIQKSAFADVPAMKVVGRATYGSPFGPYYLAIRVDQDFLISNIDQLLSNEPVRYMTVTNCMPNEDFAALIRNYRVAEQFRTTFRFRYPPRQVMTIAKAVQEAKLYWSLSLTLDGVIDRNRMIAAHFVMNNNISQGTKLFVGRPPTESCAHP